MSPPHALPRVKGEQRHDEASSSLRRSVRSSEFHVFAKRPDLPCGACHTSAPPAGDPARRERLDGDLVYLALNTTEDGRHVWLMAWGAPTRRTFQREGAVSEEHRIRAPQALRCFQLDFRAQQLSSLSSASGRGHGEKSWRNEGVVPRLPCATSADAFRIGSG